MNWMDVGVSADKERNTVFRHTVPAERMVDHTVQVDGVVIQGKSDKRKWGESDGALHGTDDDLFFELLYAVDWILRYWDNLIYVSN